MKHEVKQASDPRITTDELRPHQPVMLQEVLEALQPGPNKIFLDGTLGYGGHSEAILAADNTIKLIGLDQDPVALESARQRLEPFKERTMLYPSRFQNFDDVLKQTNLSGVDGMLLDLGVSSPQLDQAERGFSLQKDGPLDMRMDPTSDLTAATIINTWSESELADLFYHYGDERKSRHYARKIVEARRRKTFTRTQELADLILRTTPGPKRRWRIHPATRIFQALRIRVNQELSALDDFLDKFLHWLKPKGRVAILSYHSLEDRRVKTKFKQAKQDNDLTLITKKPLRPSAQEISQNARARSAKLRIAERTAEEVRK